MESVLIGVSITSLSAVMAGISIALRNFAFSALIQAGSNVFKLGEKNYNEILKNSAKYSTFAGILFVINTLIGLLVSAINIFNQEGIIEINISPGGVFIILVPLFLVAIILFLICLIAGHYKFVTPEIQETTDD